MEDCTSNLLHSIFNTTHSQCGICAACTYRWRMSNKMSGDRCSVCVSVCVCECVYIYKHVYLYILKNLPLSTVKMVLDDFSFIISEIPLECVHRPVNFLSIDMTSSGWKSFLRDPQLTPVRTHTKNSHSNLRHLFSIPLFSHRSISRLSRSDPFSVFSSPFYPSIHPTNPPSIPPSLIPCLSVCVWPSVLLIKSNEVIYQELPFSELRHNSLSVKEAFSLSSSLCGMKHDQALTAWLRKCSITPWKGSLPRMAVLRLTPEGPLMARCGETR